eukprot:CAMPEP_0114494870 /NCGR_PEP_ID=MMETSP0109-20121206/4890_1 /TAXON_ID=29199 /ORGANISM="Chlorarachnion reptans, Strain CCCM449" /LENGTH=313 /DNA_ID=CAMNT_0001671951 /DNA_START=464 /DNA_END=1408 /DNA_ORIENTATION=-
MIISWRSIALRVVCAVTFSTSSVSPGWMAGNIDQDGTTYAETTFAGASTPSPSKVAEAPSAVGRPFGSTESAAPSGGHPPTLFRLASPALAARPEDSSAYLHSHVLAPNAGGERGVEEGLELDDPVSVPSALDVAAFVAGADARVDAQDAVLLPRVHPFPEEGVPLSTPLEGSQAAPDVRHRDAALLMVLPPNVESVHVLRVGLQPRDFFAIVIAIAIAIVLALAAVPLAIRALPAAALAAIRLPGAGGDEEPDLPADKGEEMERRTLERRGGGLGARGVEEEEEEEEEEDRDADADSGRGRGRTGIGGAEVR